tara:strand:+ start:7477 stop:7746 length:270 start_codon:yes stop_codon:yes gene_type:complete
MNNLNLTGIITALLVIVSGGLTTWMFKLDDRQFDIQSTVVTRTELLQTITRLETRMDRRFDLQDETLGKLFDILREQQRDSAHPTPPLP